MKSDDSRQQFTAILARCALHEEKALDELYHLISSHLFSVALRIVHRKDWAEEVLQECFVSIWRNASSYNSSKGHPVTWMVSIVRNRSIDWIRNVANKPDHNYELDEELLQVLETPQSSLIEQEWSQAIIECLEQLDRPQRDSIALAYFKGYTHQELVRSMQSPLGTVKSWIRRGLEKLKRCLTLEA